MSFVPLCGVMACKKKHLSLPSFALEIFGNFDKICPKKCPLGKTFLSPFWTSFLLNPHEIRPRPYLGEGLILGVRAPPTPHERIEGGMTKGRKDPTAGPRIDPAPQCWQTWRASRRRLTRWASARPGWTRSSPAWTVWWGEGVWCGVGGDANTFLCIYCVFWFRQHFLSFYVFVCVFLLPFLCVFSVLEKFVLLCFLCVFFVAFLCVACFEGPPAYGREERLACPSRVARPPCLRVL